MADGTLRYKGVLGTIAGIARARGRISRRTATDSAARAGQVARRTGRKKREGKGAKERASEARWRTD